MSSSVALSVSHLSKVFYRHQQYTLKELIPALLGKYRQSTTFLALKDVSFEVKKGESFGIIGINGSGKSTLLKLIAGVSEPTNGKITVNGKIAPLIELGAGFHPDLTGRENIFLNGIILGLKRREVAEKFNAIVDFSELHNFIDQPVKHYSSGMYLRLAYAIAVHTQPDILLIDEILAVGDAAFQKKCLDKIRELQRKKVTIVIISHEDFVIENFTKRALLLESGNAVMIGPTAQVLKRYRKKKF